MLRNQKIVGVKGGLRTQSRRPSFSAVRTGKRHNVLADLSGGLAGTTPPAGGIPTGDVNISPITYNSAFGSELHYYMSGVLPSAIPQVTDATTLIPFYRDMYLYDSIAGAAVDINATFPFSDFDLRGLDKQDLKPFWDNLERLNIRRMMPEIATSYLTDGHFTGSLIFDGERNQFIDTMVHDALMCNIQDTPMYNAGPEIIVQVPSQLLSLMGDSGAYISRYLQGLPQNFVNLLRSGQFRLDPVATMYLPRKTLADRPFVSYLHRLLPMYLIEKALFRGTLIEAHRRQRAMTQVRMGDDLWTPENEEMIGIMEQFMAAESDPTGGWVATRNAVDTVDLRPGGDFWKWTDMVDQMVQYKLRALGISEAFLSGDASFAAAESAYSTFLESCDSFRENLTHRVFTQKLFPLIALANGLWAEDATDEDKQADAASFLFNATARNALKVPHLIWDKPLHAETEVDLMERLEVLDGKGVPIPIKMWMTAADVDSDVLLRELEEDKILRDRLEKFTGKDTSYDQDGDEELDAMVYALSSHTRRKPLLARDFGDPEITETNRSGSGRKWIYDQKAAQERANRNIAKASVAMRDRNHRQAVAKRNKRLTGRSTLKGF